MHDVTWIGSRMFTNTAGYHDSYRSSTPRVAWSYGSTRDAGLAQVPGGGYPRNRLIPFSIGRLARSASSQGDELQAQACFRIAADSSAAF